MRIDVSKLSYTKPTSFVEEVSFDPEVFKCIFPLKEIKEAKATAKVTRYDDSINVHLSVVSKVVLISSYSLKEFETTLKEEDEFNFVSVLPEYDEDDFIIYQGNRIDLDEYVFALISSAVPLKPVMDGETTPSGGKNYVVTTDEDDIKTKEEEGNGRFSKLDELEFD